MNVDVDVDVDVDVNLFQRFLCLPNLAEEDFGYGRNVRLTISLLPLIYSRLPSVPLSEREGDLIVC